MEMPPADSRSRARDLLMGLQDSICAGLERLDGEGRFQEESWERPEGGGGRSRVLREGRVFEQGGVNFSEVEGDRLPPSILSQRPEAEGQRWFATGTSMVLHPRNPYVPTVHLNYRYFEAGPVWWFGGGADLTPYYLFEEDAAHFHRTLRDACERHAPGSYGRWKRKADDYFFLRHRGEHRGVGGVFYEDEGGGLERELAFAGELSRAFLAAYLPILRRRRDLPYGEEERRWQELRRGRYVEFNLVWDRGTVFGLETAGRAESILMSLPPRVRWAYDHHPAPGSREATLLEVLRRPRDWA